MYNDLNKSIQQIDNRYPVILPYKGIDKPFFIYRKSIRPVIYLETINKSQYGTFEIVTYKLNSKDQLELAASGVISEEYKTNWIKSHKEGLQNGNNEH
jgi:hypothetical protein